MMVYKNARIQILDVPGLIEGAEEGKGRGREVLSVARGADLIILITDLERIAAFKRISNALERNGIRLNQNPPQVKVDKKLQGGILVRSNIRQDLSKETIKGIASEMGVKNAEITINEKLTLDRLIDSFSVNRAYISALFVINKMDLSHKRFDELIHRYNPIFISAEKGGGVDKLKEEIWKPLNFIRVFLIHPDEEPSHKNPIVSKQGKRLSEIAHGIGSDFLEDKKRAKIWGTGAKYPGQEVSLLTYALDGMQVRFI